MGSDPDSVDVDTASYSNVRRRAKSDELVTLKLHYKLPNSEKSALIEIALADKMEDFEKATMDFRFSTAVASFGMLLRDSPYKGDSSFGHLLAWAKSSQGPDRGCPRAEFVTLVEKARRLVSSH
jgi:Ca-activated chloride channel family protein